MNALYIDDDPTNRLVMRHMLELRQVAMTEASDAQTGLDLLATGRFGIALIDLRMPEISGLTAIRIVRARTDAVGRVPVVVVTGEATTGVRRMCKDAGADAVLGKPLILEELLETIDALAGEAVAAAF